MLACKHKNYLCISEILLAVTRDPDRLSGLPSMSWHAPSSRGEARDPGPSSKHAICGIGRQENVTCSEVAVLDMNQTGLSQPTNRTCIFFLSGQTIAMLQSPGA
jgi:hypothetical protein